VLTGHVHRACDLLELARVDEAREEAVIAATLVEELGQPALRYFVLWLQSTLALIDGLFEDAEKLAHESFELGVSANHRDAAVVYGTQLVVFAWQRGDTTALVEPTLDILTRVPDLPAWRSALALVLALGGRPDDARAELRRVTQSLNNLTFTSTWTPALIGLAEVARQLDEPSVAARLYEGLADYPDRMSVISLSLSEMGPISRALGVLAGLQGDHARAERHFAEALAICERISSPPHTTRTQVELARVLLDRRADDDVDRARELLDVALPAARELGMGGVLLDILQLKSAVS